MRLGVPNQNYSHFVTMAAVDTQKPKRWRRSWDSFSELTHEVHRGFIAEWTVTII